MTTSLILYLKYANLYCPNKPNSLYTNQYVY